MMVGQAQVHLLLQNTVSHAVPPGPPVSECDRQGATCEAIRTHPLQQRTSTRRFLPWHVPQLGQRPPRAQPV